MLTFKFVVTFLLFWLAAGFVGLISDSKVPRRILTSATVLCVGVLTYFLWHV